MLWKLWYKGNIFTCMKSFLVVFAEQTLRRDKKTRKFSSERYSNYNVIKKMPYKHGCNDEYSFKFNKKSNFLWSFKKILFCLQFEFIFECLVPLFKVVFYFWWNIIKKIFYWRQNKVKIWNFMCFNNKCLF